MTLSPTRHSLARLTPATEPQGGSPSACRALGTLLAFVLAIWGVSPAAAQPTISAVHPRGCLPGETSRLTLVGKGFDETLQAITSLPDTQVAFESVEAEKVILVVTPPAAATPGPLGVWIAGAGGAAEPFVLLVDDLPTVGQLPDNVSREAAQPLELPVAVDGVSRGAQASYYRFEAEAGQRVAIEILTQPLESTMDPVIRLLDAQGETIVLADDDEIGPDCRFAHTFAEPGQYQIEVRDNRYAAGGPYRLRVGDFPILQHAWPVAITAGQTTVVNFAGPDAAAAEPRELTPVAEHPDTVTTVATRLPGGTSSAWVPLRITPLPTRLVTPAASDSPDAVGPATDEPGAEPLVAPVVISGHINEPGGRELTPVRGIQGQTVRFQALARSLSCPTLPRLRLLNSGGAIVAETKVADGDEWQLDFAFPDDETYQLEVSDLVGRGGEGFGYAVELIPAGKFFVHTKPDAAVKQQFAIESAHGALSLDVQIDRFQYDGEIEITLHDAPAGLRILNPRIPAAAKEAKLMLAADEAWAPGAFTKLALRAHAVDDPTNVTTVDNLAWQRIKRPHLPFPIRWNHGAVTLAAIPPTDPFFTLQPAAQPRLATPLTSHPVTLQLARSDETFKGAVTLIPDSVPEGWQVEIKAEQDTYTATWTRTGEGVSEPASLRLLAFAEHANRSRVSPIVVEPQWYQPLAVSIEPFATPSPANSTPGEGITATPLVAGMQARLVARIVREGDDAQAVTLQLTQPLAGITVPESLTIPADQDSVEFTVELAADLPPDATTVAIPFTAASRHREQDFTLTGRSAPLSIVASPASLEIFPAEFELVGGKDRQQVVVTGLDDLGMARDWTRLAQITSADPSIAEVRGTAVFPRADGETQIIIQAGKHRLEVPLRVTQTGEAWRTRFESEVLVALSKQGCNSGACHGSPSGKGMFRLSLRAFDAKLDELTLIREDYGRRLNPIDPDQSLLLLKPLMKVTHGGGKQIKPDDEAYAILRDWIAEGAQTDPEGTPRCVRLEVVPGNKRVLRLEEGSQQFAATAHFADGSRRDVTHLVAYESSDQSVAEVDVHGLVTPNRRGEAVILVRFLEHIESVPLMFIEQIADFVWQEPTPHNYVDELVNAKLRQLQYLPADTCSDSEFIRRVHLDLIGILPTVERTREFLADESPDKRSRLIDELLLRDEFAKFWALKWGDLLKMTGKLVGNEGIYKYHRWVEEAFRTNMPYDEFARALLTTSGSTLANPPANFYRTATDMNECVENISQVFLGARLQCAKCHNHPFERWTQDNYYGLGAFFNRVERRKTQRPGEMFIWHSSSGEVTQPRTGETLQPWAPVVGSLDLADDVDRREAFANWLIDPDNPFFARMEVNRIWAQLFARGIVDPIDDFRDSNPPSNESLLDTLAKDFADSGFDRRHVLRVILNSRTYQASYVTTPLNRDDSLYFSHQQPRLLGAEQLLDAINHVVGLDQPFGGLPANTKATHLPAPDLVKIDFLKVFGQPERTTVCACERVDDSNLGMAIELFNGPTIHDKLRAEATRYRTGLAAGKTPQELIEELYLAAFCRYPSEEESAAASEHVAKQESPQAALEDIAWALLNTDEFLFQH
ncbi:MAG: DUF1549 domain-containing protein [Planctomycetaceae bacterium]|nr:MAG: DUF1549 domain-containing protein [Planctomycetaceae bacterium]